jgi:dihydroorotate dehydrogenase/Pyruvate/2-oxoacid:ferredoxin oxidoreductase delta subunit
MSETVDLSVNFAGLKMQNPFIVGSGPTVKNADQIREAQDNGWAGVSIKLAIDPFPYINLPPRYRWLKKQQIHIFTAETRLTADYSLKTLEEARRVADEIVIFPTITYDGIDQDGWPKLAKRFENAGAQAIELNMCCPNMSFNLTATGAVSEKATGASLGLDLKELGKVVGMICEAVTIPVIVKLTPEGGGIGQAAQAAIQAGAAAVGNVANRLGIPPFDILDPAGTIYRLQDNITLGCISGPWLRPLALRDTYEMRFTLGREPFIIGAGGICDLQSAVEQIMVGADAVWVCTETMLRGFGWLPKLLSELKAYMRKMGYRTIGDFRDLLHSNIVNAAELKVHNGWAKIDPEKCTSCGLCWKIGHCQAILHPDGVSRVDPDRCMGCSTCVDICPRGAVSMVAAR